MGWDCSWNRLGKAFDFCPDYFQVCQNLNDTNNPGFSERDDVACAVSPFQSNLSSWHNSAGHHMHTEPQNGESMIWTKIQAWHFLYHFTYSTAHLHNPPCLDISRLTFNLQVLVLLIWCCKWQGESRDRNIDYLSLQGVTLSPLSWCKDVL